MATVRLSFSPAPVHVRTARLVGVAVARRAGVAEELLDEVRLAIGEACTRAVTLHRQYGLTDLVTVEMSDSDSYTVRVIDHAPIEASVGLGYALSLRFSFSEKVDFGRRRLISPNSSTRNRSMAASTMPCVWRFRVRMNCWRSGSGCRCFLGASIVSPRFWTWASSELCIEEGLVGCVHHIRNAEQDERGKQRGHASPGTGRRWSHLGQCVA